MKKSAKNRAKRILDALRDKAPLSDNKGPLLREYTISHSKKDKKRKGHVEARIIKPDMKWSQIKEEGIEPEKYWDDWRDRRDGMRFNKHALDKVITPEKVEKQKQIRKARKQKC